MAEDNCSLDQVETEDEIGKIEDGKGGVHLVDGESGTVITGILEEGEGHMSHSDSLGGGDSLDSSLLQSNANVHVETIEDEDKLSHVIIYAQADPGGDSQLGQAENLDGHPPRKRYRVEQEDGQTYILTVTDPDGNYALEAAEDGEDVTDASASSSGVASPKPTDITQSWFTNREEKTALHSKGVKWKQGQWSKEEVDLLQMNIVNYCKSHGIADPTEIIFEMSKDERKDFYRRIAVGLERPLFSVYRRVIRMYDQKNHMGKYTPEEIEKLRELKVKYGTDWARIGQALGRSAASVKDRCRLMKDTCNSGKWLNDEEKRLAEAVMNLTGGKQGDSVTSGLSWAAVADHVKTRSEKQCRTKWLNYLNWKNKGGTDWTRDDDIQLTLRIIESGVNDENEVDWEGLTRNWSSARSPQWLRGKWWQLKRHVPDYHALSLQEIAANLSEMHSQNIRSKPQTNAVRFTSLPRVSVVQQAGGTGVLHVPITVQSGQTVAALSTEETDGASFQAYELVQGLPTSSGAFLITQPQTNPHISFATGGMATDHIIVHTLPMSSTQLPDSMRSNENVTVQLNHLNQSQVIIQTQQGEQRVVALDMSAAGQGIEDGEQDVVPLAQASQQPPELGQVELSTDALSEIKVINSEVDQTEIGDSVAVPGGLVMVTSDASSLDSGGHDGTGVTTHLVMSSAAGSFVQSNSNDGELMMTSLSDPMLPSESSDLIGSASDGEVDKSQSAVDDPSDS
ncbi:cyclin-D-binding Myb-like transcription factor 1 [Lingula anatina]|uniref:Cyclin-D-binding Myb-like transcription factor 1 n=1 Tax=Lingula anatina TaxID=7574 RepID=A0A1S3I503_LINAN|nr:cyclin-D-binding Myb-like transcription factor 1 [Lingula anatina]|eukprot:XP_013393350.1 cyclin-D-binding Myb-like transcription factor 1 [Lingula anatina]